MNETNKNAAIADIARDSLECIEKVALDAENGRASHKRLGPRVLVPNNTFNNPKQIDSLHKVSDSMAAALEALIRRPVIARVSVIDQSGEEDTVFITHTAPSRSVPGYKIASYRTEYGKIASFAAGQEGSFKIGKIERDLLIESRALLEPKRDGEGWDSRDTEIDIRGRGQFTIGSLRKFLETQAQIDESVFDAIWDDDADKNVVEGIRRSIITHIGLRDQPILDRYQDEIFRMPINRKCFLSGPPGTGKTTTLIKRLGQKTDRQAIEESPQESQLIERVEKETGKQRERNWIVFSPTELLRQYVKEAFAREGIAASDDHIRTWKSFRHELAREELGLLRTSTGKGAFVERCSRDHLNPDNIVDEAAWYDDFRTFLDDSAAAELRSDAQWLANSEASDLNNVGTLLSDAFKEPGGDFYYHAMSNVSKLAPDIRGALASRSDEINGILVKARNRLTQEDRNFPDLLRAEISRQLNAAIEVVEDEDDPEVALDDEEEAVAEPQTGRTVGRKQALIRFERALKALAKAHLARRRVPEKSPNGLLLGWLGSERIPSDEDLDKLGRLVTEQARLRKFERLEGLFLRGVALKYKKFRSDRTKKSRWYLDTPPKSSDIHWQELDLVVLALLQIANQLLAFFRGQSSPILPNGGLLGSVRFLQRAQVLVDEATDFSRVQLACMHEIAHPTTSSFFLCGDINQRLTPWGLKSSEALDWIVPSIERKSITVSYRQSACLVELAKKVAEIGGSRAEDIILPDRLDAEGVDPVWQGNLKDHAQISDWLTQRIKEIDRMVQKSTTIAVLVNEEADVEPLAAALNERLEEISLSAVPCKDGRVVGNDSDVRVFNIRHIKGLEFEAVFFVDLDRTITKHSELFTKYLYVGATRAATYLGVSFRDDVPTKVASLAPCFGNDWSM